MSPKSEGKKPDTGTGTGTGYKPPYVADPDEGDHPRVISPTEQVHSSPKNMTSTSSSGHLDEVSSQPASDEAVADSISDSDDSMPGLLVTSPTAKKDTATDKETDNYTMREIQTSGDTVAKVETASDHAVKSDPSVKPDSDGDGDLETPAYKIYDHRIDPETKQYELLVKWKGRELFTWEFEKDLAQCKSLPIERAANSPQPPTVPQSTFDSPSPTLAGPAIICGVPSGLNLNVASSSNTRPTGESSAADRGTTRGTTRTQPAGNQPLPAGPRAGAPPQSSHPSAASGRMPGTFPNSPPPRDGIARGATPELLRFRVAAAGTSSGTGQSSSNNGGAAGSRARGQDPGPANNIVPPHTARNVYVEALPGLMYTEPATWHAANLQAGPDLSRYTLPDIFGDLGGYERAVAAALSTATIRLGQYDPPSAGAEGSLLPAEQLRARELARHAEDRAELVEATGAGDAETRDGDARVAHGARPTIREYHSHWQNAPGIRETGRRTHDASARRELNGQGRDARVETPHRELVGDLDVVCFSLDTFLARFSCGHHILTRFSRSLHPALEPRTSPSTHRRPTRTSEDSLCSRRWSSGRSRRVWTAALHSRDSPWWLPPWPSLELQSPGCFATDCIEIWRETPDPLSGLYDTHEVWDCDDELRRGPCLHKTFFMTSSSHG